MPGPSTVGAGVVSPRLLVPFAAMSASYFAHIGFFNPYLSLWLKELGYGVSVIGLLISFQAFTRLYSPYAWGWISDRTGHRVLLLRISAGVVLALPFLQCAQAQTYPARTVEIVARIGAARAARSGRPTAADWPFCALRKLRHRSSWRRQCR